jgi:predicted extracellular nuclease
MTRRHGWHVLSLIVVCTMLASLVTVGTQSVAAATPTELYFSEYIEGSSNNKALEIYNGTGAPVDLAAEQYVVQMYFNGATTAGLNVNLGDAANDIVAPGDVFVMAPNATNLAPAIAAQADLLTTSLSWFNGDDAVVLRKGGVTGTIIDSIGQIGFDPGTEWGTGLTSTADNTIRRKSSVSAGDTNTGDVFDPSVEWDGFAVDTFGDLGSYGVTPPPTSTPTTTPPTSTPTTVPPTPTTTPPTPTPTPTTPPDGSCPTTANLRTIPALQGTTDTNTTNGQTVTVRGVVVADVQGATGQNGFYVQDPQGDSNANTSDGLFVFVPSANSAWFGFDVAVGEAVQVSGRATEFQGMTEIDTVTSIVKCGTPATLTPTVVDLPETTNGELERYEGMLITISETLTVDQNFFQGRYGQVTLSTGGRLYNPTNVYDAGSPAAIALADENARRLIVLDDATSRQNPNPIPYIGADNTLRAGDTTPGLTGTLDFGPINSDTSIRDYRVQPTQPVSFTRDNQRTAAPEAVGGNAKVASFNVLNYFNGNGQGGGFPTSRGANTTTEFTRQRDKIIAALTAMDADVVGLMEMENDGNGQYSAAQDLVNGLNAATAPGTYATTAIPTGDPNPDPQLLGTDEIRVALIYKPGRVTPVGTPLTSGDPIFSRPPLVQTFQLNSNGARFSVVVNHFKSKGSCPASSSDPNADQGDGQGCWNLQRVQQAEALLSFIDNTVVPAAVDSDVLIIGDLNAYGQEDPIQTLIAGGFVNEIAKFVGANAYSYVFDGQAGYLDHALASSSLDAQVSDVTEWHINADEPSVIDYNTEFKPQDLYAPTPYRSSDHDPVVIGLNLATPNTAPTVDAGGPYSVNEGGSVALSATGSDPESGPLSYDWDLDNDGTFETTGQSVNFSAASLDGPSSRTVGVRVADNGGLTATDTATINVLNVLPTVTAPANQSATKGAATTFNLGSFADPGPDAPWTVTVNWGDGSAPLIYTINTAGSLGSASHTYANTGQYTVTITVTDKDGGVGSASFNVSVGFVFSGFFQPIDNLPTVNTVNSGRAIPVKFSLSGYQGLNIFAAGYPKSQQISCSSSAPSDAVEETSSAGNSGLSYDPSTDTYTYVWKTEKSWANTCRQLIVKLSDGTTHYANFRFTR